MTADTQHTLADRLQDKATKLGFDAFGITNPASIGAAGKRFSEFLELGRHGDMTWLAASAARRYDPRALWPEARTVVMLAMSYTPSADPLAILDERDRGAISVYAQGKDYHDVLKANLKRLAAWFAHESGGGVKVFVDTAPLLEKPLAAAAGLGWQGKHTNLVSRHHGSWLFLGALLTDVAMQPNSPEHDRCGSCRRCLDICPTDAFPSPYVLEPRRCIAYLTIEHKGHIAPEFRAPIGNRVFGCDDCLAVCPWNKFAQAASEARFAARAETHNPSLGDLLAMDDNAFRTRFAGTPVKRTGRDRFLRNVLIAAGNSADAALIPAVVKHLPDPSPLVRAMAVWALRKLETFETFQRAKLKHSTLERDPYVQSEWHVAETPGAGS